MNLEQLFRDHWPRLVAVLARDTGDLGLAEDCVQEAFAAAANWGAAPPENAAGWLYRTARNRAIDRIRRDRRVRATAPELLPEREFSGGSLSPEDAAVLGTIFGCCHPALATETQIALTLRYAAGLTTEQIARAYLVPVETMAKRLVRAKHKIRASRIPLTVPNDIRDRLPAVLHVVYLVFTEGHASRSDTVLVRGELCDEARWLAGVVMRLLPDQPEALGLAALLAFTDARRAARLDGEGRLVLLEDQDRSLWDRPSIAEGHALLERATALRSPGPYQLQAAIAAVHSSSPTHEQTDWGTIIRLYRRLYAMLPTQVVALNLGCALAMAVGPKQGLRFIDAHAGELVGYPYLPAARARLWERIGRHDEARTEYERAIALLRDGPERDHLRARLGRLPEQND